MCGIAGAVEFGGRTEVDPQVLRRMCAAMVHRGPDDEGVYTDGRIGLAMRRLSIIDVAAGTSTPQQRGRHDLDCLQR